LLLEKNSDEELVQIVRRETGRIDGIVSRMLHFAGSGSTNLRPLHVHEILEHALRLVQPQLEGKSISLERTFKAEPDLVKGDEDELQQAFVNLVLNALEAMSAGAQLSVGTENRSDKSSGQPHLVVSIQDTGAGILPEHMPHLFQPFFTTKASGTGLGLATTRRIIQEHGGSIAVESRPGHGTTFSIVFPQLVDDGGATPASENSSKGNGGFS
jgi:two-component system NtrC family sensor kinase